jgi:hypothetical protein
MMHPLELSDFYLNLSGPGKTDGVADRTTGMKLRIKISQTKAGVGSPFRTAAAQAEDGSAWHLPMICRRLTLIVM